MHHYAHSSEIIQMLLNRQLSVVCCVRCGDSIHRSLLCSVLFSLEFECLSKSPLLLPDMSRSQWFHQRPDKILRDPSPSPSAVVKWALDQFVQGEEASWAAMGHSSQPVSRNKWIKTPHFLVFLSIIEISYTQESHQSLSTVHIFPLSPSGSVQW